MNRHLNPLMTLPREQVELSGSFNPAGTGAPTSVRGVGVSVARTGVGTFTLTLTEKVADIINVMGTLALNAPANSMVQGGAAPAKNAAGYYVITIVTATAGAAADIAANANNVVHWRILAAHSATKPYV